MKPVKFLPPLLASIAMAGPVPAEPPVLSADAAAIALVPVGQYRAGVSRKSVAEIVAYDGGSQRAFVVSADSVQVDVLDLSDSAKPDAAFTIGVLYIGADAGSVATNGGAINHGISPLPDLSDIRLGR